MTWKSYAAVSGATVLAGWLASSEPSNAPAGAAQSQRVAPTTRAAAVADSDIERQAMRLEARVSQTTTFRQPERNPFRFGERQPARPALGGSPVAPAQVEAPEPVPPLPAVSLAGIAEDQVGEKTERTAILSAPSDVLLVREGDEVLGLYRVVKIDANAVELVRLADGTTLRLALSVSSLP